MKTISIASSLVLGAVQLQAGTITVEGTSNLGHKPDFVAVDVQIASECFASEQEVLQATNGAASKIREIMKNHLSTSPDSRDQIIARPGATTRSDRSRYNPETRRIEIACRNGWHSNNSLTVKVADASVWSAMQREILGVVDEYDQMESDTAKVKLTVHAPRPHLYPETVAELKIQAEEQALQDGTRRFKRIQRLCHLSNPTIQKLSTDVSRPVAYSNRMDEAAPSSDAGSAEFQPEFDLIYVRSSWNVTWKFRDNGHGCDAEEAEEAQSAETSSSFNSENF